MNTEQYLNQTLELLRLQIKTKAVFTEREMEDFRRIKPVPLAVQMIEILNKKYKQPGSVDIYDFEKRIAMPLNYPQLEDVLELIHKIYLEENRELDAARVSLKIAFVQNDLKRFCETYDNLELFCKDFLENRMESMQNIEERLYIVEDMVALRILSNEDEKYDKVFEEPNMGFLAEELQDTDSKFILMEGDSNVNLVNLIALFLEKHGKEVFVLKQPLCYEGEGILITDTVAISVENIQKEGNITYVYPIKIVSEENGEEDNIPYLLEYINNHYNSGGHINVLGQGYQVDELCIRPFINKKLTRLSNYYYDKREYNLALARYGDYLEYISKIYKEDCRELLYRESTKDFSIVIPVRDSVETLKHTLNTCLEQDYKGEYEIVISDNSVKNTDVYEFCKQINNPKIKYIKTPRNLGLVKSFEFAHLHTSGRYIVALGADDGLLSWALSTLADVTSSFPNELVIGWNRGFYAWPGFNGGQQHQLVIPGMNYRDKIHLFYRNHESYFKSILDDPQKMYMLPLLYINSCFKRELLHKMYEETGELFDGRNQDIATGIVMIAINEKVLNVSKPLTIAGMSSGSVGATTNKAIKVDVAPKKQKELSIGVNVNTYYEHMIPFMGSDVSSQYLSMMRAVSKGLLSYSKIAEQIDWKKAFIDMLDSRRVDYITYYEDIYKARYAATFHGEEFLKWFDEEVIPQRMKLCMIDEEVFLKIKGKRKYQVGMDDYGTLTLDASEYHVNNIHEAVHLFEKIYNE